MIVLGNSEFAVGMKLAGVVNSFVVKSREQGLEALRKIERHDFVIANASIIKLLPELEELENVVSVPDSAQDFGNIDDLKEMIRSVIGFELEA